MCKQEQYKYRFESIAHFFVFNLGPALFPPTFLLKMLDWLNKWQSIPQHVYFYDLTTKHC